MVTILVLLAGVALPNFAAAVGRARLDNAVEAVAGALRFARARAVATGLRHAFVLDPETGEITVQPYRPEEQAAPAGGSQAVMEGAALRDRLPEEVRVTGWSLAPLGYAQAAQQAAAEPGAGLVFYPEGRSDSALLVLEDAERNRRVLRVEGFSGEIEETPEGSLPVR